MTLSPYALGFSKRRISVDCQVTPSSREISTRMIFRPPPVKKESESHTDGWSENRPNATAFCRQILEDEVPERHQRHPSDHFKLLSFLHRTSVTNILAQRKLVLFQSSDKTHVWWCADECTIQANYCRALSGFTTRVQLERQNEHRSDHRHKQDLPIPWTSDQLQLVWIRRVCSRRFWRVWRIWTF